MGGGDGLPPSLICDARLPRPNVDHSNSGDTPRIYPSHVQDGADGGSSQLRQLSANC